MMNRRGLPCAAIALTLALAALPALADWPTHRHDIARSAVTEEALALPLHEQWQVRTAAAPKPAWTDPKPVPVEGFLERPRLRFDDAYYAVAANGLVYFADAGENKLVALEAATGREVWSFYTDAPPRLAPTVVEGKVYLGADDGHVYCLEAAEGRPLWRFDAAPESRLVLGNGRLMSLWPVRTSVLVDGGVAYFAAGVFPAERVYVFAVDANDGTLLWKNDTLSDSRAGQESFLPQGYLLATNTRLYVPTGRTMPAAFDRKTGRSLGRSNISKGTGMVGGTYALLSGDRLYTGTQEITSVDDQGAGKFAWFRGSQLVVSGGTSFLLSDRGLAAYALDQYASLSKRRKTLENQRRGATDQLNREKDPTRKAELAAQVEQYDKDLAALDPELEDAEPWTLKQPGLASLILAGDTLLAGGDGQVIAVSAGTGEKLWTAALEGVAKGLAVADGRLLVSTDRGTLYCFANGEAEARDATPPVASLPEDDLTHKCAQAADEIVRRTGVTRGYCLVWGSGTGRLAAELAKRTKLNIYGIERDRALVNSSRNLLSAAGLYGSRVTIVEDPLTKPPYTNTPLPDYFANLIVSEATLTGGTVPGSPAELFRVLKPCGGTVCLPGADPVGWLSAVDLQGSRPTVDTGWTKLVRGRLPNTDDWSHQYGNAGNPAASADLLVKCPLGVLWFGEPGPATAISRHQGAPAPLVVNGRVFYEGERDDRAGKHLVLAFDAYNGTPLWERSLPGANRVAMHRECSNLAATDDALFVARNAECLRLDPDTGETLHTYPVPPTADGASRKWGWVAVVDGLLFGSATERGEYSDRVFAIDLNTGAVLWSHAGKAIKHNTLTVSGGRVYYADRTSSQQQRALALAEQVAELKRRRNLSELQALQRLDSADVRLAVALDARTGKVVWEKPVDLTDCGGDVLVAMCQDDVLLFCGAHRNGHFWPQFLAGEYAARKIVALSASDGALLWQKPIGYRIRPLVIGDTIIAEPWAFDLHTGQQKTRRHPLTGAVSNWQFERPGHHCGTISGSPNALFFRSGTIAYYDLIADQGTNHFAGQRPGCWINIIPADGVVVVPEGSSGCVCPFPLQSTVVFQHRDTNKAWGVYSAPGEVSLIRELNLNLGAPGDRRGPDGALWLGYPRPWGRMGVTLDASVSLFPGQGYFETPAEYAQIANTNAPWLYASGVRGLKRLTLPVAGAADGTGLYTVRLGFVDTDNTSPGQRVFDLKLQGKVVESGFDPLAAAGGPARAIVREFRDLALEDRLELELVPTTSNPTPNQQPLLNTLQLIRQETLSVGLAAPDFDLSDGGGEAQLTIPLANNTDRAFSGKLVLSLPPGFVSRPSEVPLSLPVGGRAEATFAVRVEKPGTPAQHQITWRLVRDDGTEEATRTSVLDYLGPRARKVIPVSEDAYVNAANPTKNFGHAATLLVDGGASQMGDHSHNIGYLKFLLDIPGRVVSVKLQIHTSPAEASESGQSGNIHLVEAKWDEYTLSYDQRPKPGPVVGQLGRVGRDQLEVRDLTVDLTGRRELSLVLEPTSTDGANYYAREGGKPAQLVVEYLPE